MYLVSEANPNSIHNEKMARHIFDSIKNLMMEGRKGAAATAAEKMVMKIKQILEKKDSEERGGALEKWKEIESTLGKPYGWVVKHVIFSMTYPRLDLNVSTHRNHLLKAPFVIHPGTGNVCVPLDFERIDSFAPENCLSLEKVLADYDRESILFPPDVSSVFQKFLEACEEDSRKVSEEAKLNGHETDIITTSKETWRN